MALEAVPSSSPSPAPSGGAQVTTGAAQNSAGGQSFASTIGAQSAASSGATSGAAPATGGKTATDTAADAPAAANAVGAAFLQLLAGASPSAATTSTDETSSADKPATESTDDTDDDEIGFEDLSEFLSQVLVPGTNAPPPPPASSDDTVEIDFSGDDSSELSSEMMSALAASMNGAGKSPLTTGADAMAKTDPVITLDTSLLNDALAAEKSVGAALDPNAVAPADADGANAISYSALHAAAMHTTHAASHTGTPAELRSTVGTQQWADELGGHLTWMAAQGREAATLTLSPEHLGPVEVRISVQDGQTSVWFGAQNADTRAALEQALPRLRDLFSAQGLSLADSGVFREAPRQQQSSGFSGSRGNTGEDEISGVTSVAKRGNGVLDLYA